MALCLFVSGALSFLDPRRMTLDRSMGFLDRGEQSKLILSDNTPLIRLQVRFTGRPGRSAPCRALDDRHHTHSGYSGRTRQCFCVRGHSQSPQYRLVEGFGMPFCCCFLVPFYTLPPGLHWLSAFPILSSPQTAGRFLAQTRCLETVITLRCN